MIDVKMGSDENQDFISALPNEVLTFILSKLHVDETVRCNILSKRWLGLWKKAPHIEFNAKHMIRPLSISPFQKVYQLDKSILGLNF
ncbi:hypothetical protein P8452_51359 [Trifolium repens]|nr:hypothetical protein P8452_51359 [Trifolium repens]